MNICYGICLSHFNRVVDSISVRIAPKRGYRVKTHAHLPLPSKNKMFSNVVYNLVPEIVKKVGGVGGAELS